MVNSLFIVNHHFGGPNFKVESVVTLVYLFKNKEHGCTYFQKYLLFGILFFRCFLLQRTKANVGPM